MNICGPLGRDLLRILRDIPEVSVREAPARRRGPDFEIRAGDVAHFVDVKGRRETNAAAARQLVEYARHLPTGTPLLLVTGSTTDEARQILEEGGVGVIDALGNMRVDLPGLFLRAEGRHEPPRSNDKNGQPPVRLSGKAGVAAQALLRAPDRKWQVHDLADEASISAGLAHRLLARLEREGLVATEGTGPHRIRHITNAAALLDLWAEEMHDRQVRLVRAFRLARDQRLLAKMVSNALEVAGIEHAVTGAAAGAVLAPFVTAVPITDLWITEAISLDDAAQAAGAEVVDSGNNLIFRQAAGDVPLAFREKVEGIWTVDRFRLFHDLREDPRRGREQATRVREEVIGF